MKFPKEIRGYCPFCKKHTIQEVVIVKKKKASELAEGQRRYRRITAGYIGFPRPKLSSEKQTKRKDIRLKCKSCKKQHRRIRTFRSKKFEIKK